MSGYLYFDGTTGNYASTPDSSALDVVGDLDIRCRVALDDWQVAAVQTFVAKYPNTLSARAYDFMIYNGNFYLQWYESDGTPRSINTTTQITSTGVIDGDIVWVRMTLDVDNGAGQYELKSWQGGSGVTPSWVQLGATVTGATGVTNIRSTVGGLEIGTIRGGAVDIATGKFYRAQIYDGIAGTLVFDADFTDLTTAEITAKAFVEDSTNAATVTLNGSAWSYSPAGGFPLPTSMMMLGVG